ncbi:MAG: hypothetical protein AAGG11_07065 [Pseudomonadota bacterium]
MDGFQLVDRIVALDPGRSIHTQKTWDPEAAYLKDHFPAFPVIPGVLLCEFMQQSGALCLESAHPEYGKALLLQIRNASFRTWVLPGQTVNAHIEVLAANARLSRIRCCAEVDGAEVCSSEVRSVWTPWSEVGLSPKHPLLEAFEQSGTPRDD